MTTAEDTTIRNLTVKGLLGRPLNDVEKKYAPVTIYVKGSIQTPLPKPRVSIVGSRKATIDGLSNASIIAKTLADNGVVIVSGLAEGIDTSAHVEPWELVAKL